MRVLSKILFFIPMFWATCVSAQEVLNTLEGNSVAEEYYSQNKSAKKSLLLADTLELPFIDDFSDSNIAPKSTLWSDNFAFINGSFGIYPPSIGVATLDALNFDGSHYANAGYLPYQGDFLSSQPINLNVPESDSVYLSFYYQPGGRAEPPETADSLILDFYSPETETWTKKWAVPGIGTTADFKQVMLKIDEPEFLQKGFRFRFRNIVSQLQNPDLYDKRSNVDIWNIDYIKLDKNRFLGDTVLRDVAFMEPIKSILKDYTALPWPHFEAAKNTQRAPYITVLIENHDSIARNLGKSLEIKNLTNVGTTYKVSPLYNILSSEDSINYRYAYNYPFVFESSGRAAFEVKTILHTDFFDYKSNDTIRHIQRFYDYYALDDGTAEASYGLRGAGTKDASSALKFTAFTGDSLRAIDIYFTQVIDSLNLEYFFYLNVWADNAGKPGEKIVSQIGMQPAYSGALNKFTRYELETPVFIQGVFYIGFTQTVEKLMNIGFDLNIPNQSRIFYNSNNGIWTNSSLPGTSMMRPVFSMTPITAIETTPSENSFSAWPIPADDIVHVSLKEGFQHSPDTKIELFDISGRHIYTMDPFEESSIATGNLKNGMYFLRMNETNAPAGKALKIIINH